MTYDLHDKVDEVLSVVRRIDERTHEHSNTLETIGKTMEALQGIKSELSTIARSVDAALEPEEGYVNKLIEVLASREKQRDWLPTVALSIIGLALLALVVAVFRMDLSIDPKGSYHLGIKNEARNE